MKKLYCLILVLLLSLAAAGSLMAQITNHRIAFPTTQLQNEEQVMYCPTDGKYIVANWRDFRLGYRQCGIGRSTDGGATWTDHLNNIEVDLASWQSDPTLTADRLGNFYACFLDFQPALQNVDSSFVIFIKSTDKGASWTGPVPVTNAHGAWFEDKQFITADRTGGPHDGNVYVGWARFPNPTRIEFARSTNGGASFEDTLVVGPPPSSQACGTTDAGQFTQPIVGADGSVYVFWSGTDLYDTINCNANYSMMMSKSTDGGQTWPIKSRGIFPFNYVGSADGGIAIYNAAAGDADISAGPFAGNIYISTCNGIQDGSYYHSDVVMIKSSDGGATWTPPLRINDDPLGFDVDQFHPWLTVNQDGVIATVFYDQRMDPGHYLFDVFAAYSFDGGETFTTNHRITTVSSSPSNLARPAPGTQTDIDPWKGRFDDQGVYHYLSPLAGLIGEYIGVTANHDSITSVWTDTRDGNQNVYSASYVIPFLKPRLFGVANNGYWGRGPASLFWSTCWHQGNVSYRVEISTDSTFGTINVTTFPTSNVVDQSILSTLPDAKFYWRVKAFRNGGTDSTAYSDVWSFNLDIQAPTTATLISPINNVIVTTAHPTLTWSSLARNGLGAPEYFELEVSADSLFPGTTPYFHYSGISASSWTMPDALPSVGKYYWRVDHYDLAGNKSGYTPKAGFNYLQFICGDANGDHSVNVGDAVFLINYIFKSGPAPNPLPAGDANKDTHVNVADVVYIINYVFKAGPAPCA